MKETDGERYHVCWIERINIVKMIILPQTIYRFNTTPIILPMALFTEPEQKNSQFLWNIKDPDKPKKS